MNGILVVLSFSLLAQSNIAPLGAGLSSPQSNERDNPAGLTQFGWQLNSNNELEYLIQISPDMLPFMTSATNQKEFQSEIPRELVGRIHRVVVSIGSQVLPRRPSLQEIEQRVPAIASLPGRFRDLEPGTSVVNVNNSQLPDLPAFGGQANSDLGATANGGQSVPTSPLGGAFMDQARTAGPNPNSSVGRQPPATQSNLNASPLGSAQQNNLGQSAPNSRSNQTTNTSQTGRFADTANDASSNNSQFGNAPQGNGWQPNGWQANGNSMPAWPGGASGPEPYAQGGNQNQFGYNSPNATQLPPNYSSNQQPQYPPNQGYPQQPGYAQQPSYTQQPGFAQQNPGQTNDRRGPAFPSTSGGFGDFSGMPGQSLADRARDTGPWSNSVPSDASIRRPGDNLIASRPRENAGLLDGGRSPMDLESSSALSQAGDSNLRRSDVDRSSQRQPAVGSEHNNYHLFVFFVLSVAVNLWMVHLLRSLYLRYRTLLISLRGQAA